jgi:hypothetical protein
MRTHLEVSRPSPLLASSRNKMCLVSRMYMGFSTNIPLIKPCSEGKGSYGLGSGVQCSSEVNQCNEMQVCECKKTEVQ